MKYLHVNDEEKMPAPSTPNHDKLYKVRPLLEMITKRFKCEDAV